MLRITVLVLTLVVAPAAAFAQEVPAEAQMDLWCGTAFELMTRDAPAANAEDQAADWYVRLNADSVSPTDQGEFERWLLGHAEHRRAWQRIIDAVGAVNDITSRALEALKS